MLLLIAAAQAEDLYVSSNERGATILLNGVDTGYRTPATISGVRPGEVLVTVEGQCTRGEAVVKVVGGVTTRTSIVATDQLGTLTLIPSPIQAHLELDGTSFAGTPGVPTAVTCGEHSVRASLDGFVTAILTLDVEMGQDLRVPINLTKLGLGGLDLSVQPRGATIYLDGRAVGTDAVSLPSVYQGVHTISAELDGYQSAKRQVVVEDGTSSAFHFMLARRSQKNASSTVTQIGGPPSAGNVDGDEAERETADADAEREAAEAAEAAEREADAEAARKSAAREADAEAARKSAAREAERKAAEREAAEREAAEREAAEREAAEREAAEAEEREAAEAAEREKAERVAAERAALREAERAANNRRLADQQAAREKAAREAEEREAAEAAEREAEEREAAEAAEREAEEREAAEAAERKEREAAERKEREAAERKAREEREREKAREKDTKDGPPVGKLVGGVGLLAGGAGAGVFTLIAYDATHQAYTAYSAKIDASRTNPQLQRAADSYYDETVLPRRNLFYGSAAASGLLLAGGVVVLVVDDRLPGFVPAPGGGMLVWNGRF